MRFGPVPLDQAEGAVLAHRVDTAQGMLAKGSRLTAEGVARLRAEGVTEVIVARPDPGEVGEDAAAARLAAALVPEGTPGLRLTAAATGRVNIYATGPGVLLIDIARIEALNAVHPMITLATLPPFARVEARSMVATAKIISYAVPEQALVAACAHATGALRHAAPRLHQATLIETALPDDPAPAPKGRVAMETRLDRMDAALTPRQIVPHRTAPLVEALRQAPGELILILTASATSDENDVAPSALVAAGGRLIRFGMPVDPGNLLFLGELSGRPVIGLPGCARSPALNGADWVLERVLCGLSVTGADIARMGVGGLLKEIPQRGRLREAGLPESGPPE